MGHVDPHAATESGDGRPSTRLDSTGVVTVGAVDPARAVTVDAASVAPTTDELIGTSIGRYRVLARLGAGGMGVVYRALDPALDRTVALKILPPLDEARRVPLEERLRREAQALARLDHENVIAVYDVGIAEQSLFIAMRFVDGTTLDDYLAERPRSARQVLALFTAAGRGLAAAHAAGIVHRDVKPSNILVDRRGRVYVGDFGLARARGDVESRAASRDDLLGADMTRLGAVIGTPLFMAPEQHRGQPATERSDQFSFCVSVWYELFRRHPFAGPDAKWEREAALAAMEADEVAEPPRSRGVSGRVVRALRRGLLHDPGARWPSLGALLAELAPRSRMPWVFGGVTLIAVAGGAVAASLVGTLTTEDPCAGATARIEEVVTAPRLAQIGTGFGATGLPYAAETASRATASIESYAKTWSTMRVAACEANRVRHDESDALFDRKFACLDQRLLALDGVLAVLATSPTATVVDHTTEILGKLPALADCGDADLAAASARPPDPARRAAIDELNAELAKLGAVVAGGEIRDSPAAADALVARARVLAWPALLGRALQTAALAYYAHGDAAAAIARMRDASVEAARARDDRGAAEALVAVARWLSEAGRPADALVVAGDAELLVLHAGDPPAIRAKLLAARASALHGLSQFREAEALYEKAIATARSAPDAEPLAIATLLRDEATLLSGTSRPRDALVREAGQILEKELGAAHPRLVEIHADLGLLYGRAGKVDAARSEFDAARAILRTHAAADTQLARLEASTAQLALRSGKVAEAAASYQHVHQVLAAAEPDHPDTYKALYMLGVARMQLGKLDEALAAFQTVLAYRQRVFGDGSVLVADVLDGIANIYQQREDYANALAMRKRTLAARTAALGPDNPDVALSLQGIAFIALDQDNCADAVEASQRALAIFDKAHSDDRLRIDSLDALGSCALKAGRVAESTTHLERALAIADAKGGGTPDQRATIRADLAEALWKAGDHSRASALVREAVAIYKGLGRDDDAKPLLEWLAKHR